jgi:DNA polymerase II small subunit/DNA polymerase delta subunit B
LIKYVKLKSFEEIFTLIKSSLPPRPRGKKHVFNNVFYIQKSNDIKNVNAHTGWAVLTISLFQNEMKDKITKLDSILFSSRVHTCLLSQKNNN